MADASQGAQARMAMGTIAAASTIDAGSVPIEFLSHTLSRQGNNLDGGGIRGTRSAPAERNRLGPSTVGGTISMNPSPAFLDTMLPRILGTDTTGPQFDLGDDLLAFSIGVNLVADDFQYDGCVVNRAVFKGSAQGFVTLDLDIVGKTIADLSFPSLTDGLVDANDAPYIMSDSVLTLNSTSREVMDWEIEIDNQLDVRYTNSNTPTSITPQDRIVTLRATLPWNADTDDLYGDADHGVSPDTEGTAITDGTMVMTNTLNANNMSTSFAFADLRIDSVTPSVPGKTEVPLLITARARSLAGAAEVVVTNDSDIST